MPEGTSFLRVPLVLSSVNGMTNNSEMQNEKWRMTKSGGCCDRWNGILAPRRVSVFGYIRYLYLQEGTSCKSAPSPILFKSRTFFFFWVGLKLLPGSNRLQSWWLTAGNWFPTFVTLPCPPTNTFPSWIFTLPKRDCVSCWLLSVTVLGNEIEGILNVTWPGGKAM